jgi:hypothetical protein
MVVQLDGFNTGNPIKSVCLHLRLQLAYTDVSANLRENILVCGQMRYA